MQFFTVQFVISRNFCSCIVYVQFSGDGTDQMFHVNNCLVKIVYFLDCIINGIFLDIVFDAPVS